MHRISTNPPKVFIDANVLISAGKPPGGPEISRVQDLVEADLITVLTTDLTIIEVAKHHAKNELDVLSGISAPHFRRLVEQHTGVKLPEIRKAALREKLWNDNIASVRSMMKRLRAEELSVDAVKPSIVLGAYSTGEGFFQENIKKDQFPDAFAFESLKIMASSKQPVIIVSADNDFKRPASKEQHISHVNSFPALFEYLGLHYEAPEVEEWLEVHSREVVNLVDDELKKWYLQGDVEDSEIEEAKVSEVMIRRVTAFKPTVQGDPIFVIAAITANTTIGYSHPDWDTASYDSEDKVLIPWDTVSGESDIEIEIDISLNISVDAEGNPQHIEEISFRNDDFVYVEIHPQNPYDYM